jgi:hypothetical protein
VADRDVATSPSATNVSPSLIVQAMAMGQLLQFCKRDTDKMSAEEGDCEKVVVLLMATSAHPGLDNSVDSLRKYGVDSTVLGFGEKWGGGRHRMAAYRDAAAALPQSTLVVCMDSYDAVCLRRSTGLRQLFKSFGKPLVFSLESECGGNCVPITKWWDDHQVKPGKNRYLNGGLLMGYAWAISKLYDWILTQTPCIDDDQRGLGIYALQHPDEWAPDMAGLIFTNSVFGQPLAVVDLQERGSYFAHFPGTPTWSNFAYNQTVERILGRPSQVYSQNMGSPTLIALHVVAIVVAVTIILLFVAWMFDALPSSTVLSRVKHQFLTQFAT